MHNVSSESSSAVLYCLFVFVLVFFFSAGILQIVYLMNLDFLI